MGQGQDTQRRKTMEAECEAIAQVEASFLPTTWTDALDLRGLEWSTGDK